MLTFSLSIIQLCLILVFDFQVLLSILSVLSNELTVDLETLLDTKQYSDMILSVGESELPVHKAILAARSPVFGAMFAHSSTREVQEGRVLIEDAQKEAVVSFIRYLYTGLIPPNEQLTDELLALADKYEVPLLKDACDLMLTHSLNVENVLTLLCFAHLHDASLLRNKCLNFTLKNAFQVTHTPEWEKVIEQQPKLSVQITRLLASPKSSLKFPKVSSKNAKVMMFTLEHTWTILDFTSLFRGDARTGFSRINSVGFSASGHEAIQMQLKVSMTHPKGPIFWLKIEFDEEEIKKGVSINGILSFVDEDEDKSEIDRKGKAC